MNELQVKTIELEPAKVVFNHEEIKRELDKNLKKYSGLTFTEDDAMECKSTISELRKGKKAVDEYRKKTKKQLTEPVSKFENECKEINKKIDDVIDPLVDQYDSFEEKRKNEKLTEVHEIIAQLIEEYDLYKKYAVGLVVADNYLTKSKTIKSIKEELTTNAEHLKMKQDKEAADKENIINTVKLANAEHKLNFTESAYVRLLEFNDIADIKKQVIDDANKEVERALEKERKAKEQAEQEEKRKQEQAEQVEKWKPAPKEIAEQEEKNKKEQVLTEKLQKEPKPVKEEIIPDPFLQVEPTVSAGNPSVYEVYKTFGTESQLIELEAFMNDNNISWEVIDHE